MTRIRSVKPELFKHEELYKAEIHFKLPLRLAFIGLFTCCDRKGRFRWQPRRLKLDIFPYDDIDVSLVLDALQCRGFIVKYENQEQIYGCIPSWLQHQHINNREMASKLPSIEDSIILELKKTNINQVAAYCFSTEINALRTRQLQEDNASDTGENENNSLTEKQSLKLKEKVNRNSDALRVFDHWKTVMNHPNAKLDQKRHSIVTKALRFGYGVDELCEAITGCSYTPHNMGNNDRGQRYDGLHVILRDGDQIDRFIHNCKFPPKPITDADRRSMANVATLQSWVSKKIAEEK